MPATPTPDVTAVAKAICQAKRLTFIDKLGAGAFKTVFKVANAAGDVQALKVIPASSTSLRTAREIDAIGRCDHDGISKVFMTGSTSHGGADYDFMMEEYLAGGTLESRIASNGLLDESAALALGTSLIEILGHLHTQRIVHRDIKPENVMFRDDTLSPVLVDFGLVRNLGDVSLTATWCMQGPGTPYYAAPEQLNNEKQLIDWRTDQFGVGVVLTRVTYGFHPYQADTDPDFAPATVHRVANREPRPARFQQTVQNGPLRHLVQMTAPWPVQRFRRPSDLLQSWLV